MAHVPSPATPSPAMDCDLLVIGSGAGGLSAAVTAAHRGLRVIVAEKEPHFGGTTAWSGGWMWIPRNPLAVAAGIDEPLEAPLDYLRHELGPQFDEARARVFLEQGPRMVEFFRARTALQFIDGNAIPDFHGHTPSAASGGRSVCAAPFDGRRLGAHRARLKDPIAETTLWGMGIASGAELRHFFNARHAPASFWHVTRRVLAHARDRLVHGHSQRLVNGHALAGALAAEALAQGVQILTSAPALRLVRHAGRVLGAVLQVEGREQTVQARCGVVLACGGFAHDTERKRALLPHAPTGQEHWSAAAPGNTGDGLRLGESMGGQVATGLPQAAALAPVSRVPHPDGTWTHFPHLIERAKPGLISVTAAGTRFTNEANSYYDVVCDLLGAVPAGQPVQAWLLCDHRFIRRYGLGAVKPAPLPLGDWLANGYLLRGDTLQGLARVAGIESAALQATVARYNRMARDGHDADFAKGDTPYNRVQGDAAWANARALPNPCMAPLEQGPFYAVRVVPGSLGTFAGLKVNVAAQVLDASGQPIPGLYAGGNDMNSLMGGRYPSGGITLGPAMTFGFIAGHHAADAAAQAREQPDSVPNRPPALANAAQCAIESIAN
jgi:succinate dehydrogenase/fumarate reductase flavoprotein subunit